MAHVHPLRAYRIVHGLTCAEVARKLGIAETTVRSFENGSRKVQAELAVEIEAALGINRALLRPDLFRKTAAA